MQKILMIVPAYNEEKNIRHVIADLRSCNVKVDPLIIDDGSMDNTAKVARSEGADVIVLPCNLGIGGAVQTGFKYAFENDYDIAIQFDGDGQHMACEIETLIKNVVEDKCDVAIGSRFLTATDFKSTFARKLGIKIFTIINSIIIGQRITDNTSGFRAYNRPAIKFLSRNYPDDYPEPEAIILLSKNKFRIMEVPVKMQQRQHGDSSINTLRAIYYMIKVVLAILIGVFRNVERKD
ncbi:glycosyltransferase family 2 protein [candidate division KSB1 bacterium]|nr:glycosyltransferase family 2 protein [candidate division KSB1 bacterium]